MLLFRVHNPANGLRVCLSPYTISDTSVVDLLNQFSWGKRIWTYIILDHPCLGTLTAINSKHDGG
jgi:hypothetical protein